MASAGRIPKPPRVGNASDAGALDHSRLHDFGNELAAILGFAWLALTELRHLHERLDGDAQAHLRSIISMVERIKNGAENSRRLLSLPAGSSDTSDADAAPVVAERRVLAIDDSLPLLALLSKILGRAGYTVEAFADPVAAVARFVESPDSFDIVITDAVMPQMTGVRLARELRQFRPAMPIVLCTGAAEPPLGEGDDWATAIIRKPYRPAALSAVIERVIAAAAKEPAHTNGGLTAALDSCDDRANAE